MYMLSYSKWQNLFYVFLYQKEFESIGLLSLLRKGVKCVLNDVIGGYIKLELENILILIFCITQYPFGRI